MPGDTPLLSVLIATLTRRQQQFLRLAQDLSAQAEAAADPVEIVALQNSGEKTLAEYRQDLLNDARGEYVCFVDDDDLVADVYVKTITEVIMAERPDTVTFPQLCTGTAAPITLFGISYLGQPWQPVLVHGMPVYVRVFSHVLPVRADLARKATFVAEGMPGYTQEDQVYVQTLVPHLNQPGYREAQVSEPLYCYMFNPSDTTQDGPIAWSSPEHDRPVIASPCFRWCGE